LCDAEIAIDIVEGLSDSILPVVAWNIAELEVGL
jgi:hypothetical protein